MTAIDSLSVICPKIIGRDAHHQVVDKALATVASGRCQTLLLAGEAGMGKSRLLADIRRRAEQNGWPTRIGYCTKIEQTMPFAPVHDILRPVAVTATAGNVKPTPTESSGESHLSAAEIHLHSLHLRDAPADRLHLYGSFTRFVAAQAETGPLLLAFEDLHWSDDATLELLPYLVHHVAALPMLIVLTYRSDEVSPALSHCLAQLERLAHVHELPLAPLSRDDVELMLRTIFGQSRRVRTGFLDALYAFSEGNPFFVEESLKSMVSAGELVVTPDGVWSEQPLGRYPIPRTVQDSVRRRMERLSLVAQGLLRQAAVTGRRFDFGLLQRLSGLTEAEMLDPIRELLDAQLIVEESADLFSFRHALTRQYIYGSLLARERRRLHADIARELESLYGELRDDQIAELAYHSYAGEDWNRTQRYAHMSGERALDLFAPRAAVEQFDRALEACTRLSVPTPGRLVLRRGDAHALLGNFDAALDDFEQALNAARANGDDQLEWDALLSMGNLWSTRDFVRAGEWLDDALSVAERLQDPVKLAHSRNATGNWEMNRGRPAQAVHHHQRSLDALRLLDDAPGIAHTLDLMAIAHYNCSDIEAGRRCYLEALPLWRRMDDRRGLLHTLSGLALAADFDFECNNMTISQHLLWAEEGVSVARELGWHSGTALALICLGLVKRQQGLFGSALIVLEEALALAEEIDHKEWIADAQVAMATVWLDLEEASRAQELLEQALRRAEEIGSAIWAANASMWLARIHAQRGDVTAATAILDSVHSPESPPTTLQARGLWLARAEIALEDGRHQAALEIAGSLAAHGGSSPHDKLPAGEHRMGLRLGLIQARALAAMGRTDEARDIIEYYVAAGVEQGRYALLWRLYALQAELSRVRGDHGTPNEAIAAAQRIIETIATDVRESRMPDAQAVAERFVVRATELFPFPARDDMSRTDGTVFVRSAGPRLTAREQEVAGLVAEGRSNREISEILVLSERTAERHVANIMNKLGCHTRTQIATWYISSAQL